MVLPYVSMVQSVDSLRLLEAIDSWANVHDKAIEVLLEPHVAAEQTKQGFDKSEILIILSDHSKYAGIRFRGLMGMATFTDDESVVRYDFECLAACKVELTEYFGEEFDTLSMGMSDDYRLALEYGTTEVRIGSTIFGARQY